jgi:hypothetical protein
MRRSKAAGFIVGAVAMASGLAALGAVAGTAQASAASVGATRTCRAWTGDHPPVRGLAEWRRRALAV